MDFPGENVEESNLEFETNIKRLKLLFESRLKRITFLNEKIEESLVSKLKKNRDSINLDIWTQQLNIGEENNNNAMVLSLITESRKSLALTDHHINKVIAECEKIDETRELFKRALYDPLMNAVSILDQTCAEANDTVKNGITQNDACAFLLDKRLKEQDDEMHSSCKKLLEEVATAEKVATELLMEMKDLNGVNGANDKIVQWDSHAECVAQLIKTQSIALESKKLNISAIRNYKDGIKKVDIEIANKIKNLESISGNLDDLNTKWMLLEDEAASVSIEHDRQTTFETMELTEQKQQCLYEPLATAWELRKHAQMGMNEVAIKSADDSKTLESCLSDVKELRDVCKSISDTHARLQAEVNTKANFSLEMQAWSAESAKKGKEISDRNVNLENDIKHYTQMDVQVAWKNSDLTDEIAKLQSEIQDLFTEINQRERAMDDISNRLTLDDFDVLADKEKHLGSLKKQLEMEKASLEEELIQQGDTLILLKNHLELDHVWAENFQEVRAFEECEHETTQKINQARLKISQQSEQWNLELRKHAARSKQLENEQIKMTDENIALRKQCQLSTDENIKNKMLAVEMNGALQTKQLISIDLSTKIQKAQDQKRALEEQQRQKAQEKKMKIMPQKRTQIHSDSNSNVPWMDLIAKEDQVHPPAVNTGKKFFKSRDESIKTPCYNEPSKYKFFRSREAKNIKIEIPSAEDAYNYDEEDLQIVYDGPKPGKQKRTQKPKRVVN